MEGRVRVVFEREPNFFDSLRVHREAAVVSAVGGDGGEEILGFAIRAADPLWLEGRVTRVGYLGGLRVRPDARDLRSIKLGWELFRELHERDPLAVYFTTIQETNEIARKLLESARFGIPPYHRIGTIVSHVFSPRAPRAKPRCELVSGEEVGWDEIAGFAAEIGPSRNFFPALDAESLRGTRTPGLELGGMTLAVDGSRILGTLGRWRQTAFKQVRVAGYPVYLKLARPLANASSLISKSPYIPVAGETLELRYFCLPLVRDDRVDVFAQLLAAAAAPLGRNTHCVLGLTEADPLLEAMSFVAWKERFALYTVAFEGDPPNLSRVPYIESATL